MKRLAFALAGALLALAAPLHAQAPSLPALPGRIAPTKVLAFDGRLTRAETAALAAEADRILFAPLLRTPALAAPRGFSINRSLSIKPPARGVLQGGPSSARGNIVLLGVNPAGGSKPDAAGAYNGVGEGPAIQFTLNDPTALFANMDSDETRPAFMELDLSAPPRGGFTVLRLGVTQLIVVAKPGKLPYRYVTKAELLEREIADRAEALAQLAANAAPVLRKAQADQQAELAALPPGERAAPACVGGERRRGASSPCDDRGARYMVTIDPGYFDPKAPRTAIQLVTIGVGAPHRDEHKILTPIARDAVAQLDLNAIQRALK
ncbi:MAG: hypothetical protein GC203_05360 [Phenylobacterium sp.]|uniref:hypothetical protein n=1 Tax=Phenylobacterium sp. TaxID=1871053 RepID=UPI0025E74C86|nr:hypothetical protein [Phenylobacterium sp.]MBI1197271.1 hypothetical protein [Phenylobacterium sp.]